MFIRGGSASRVAEPQLDAGWPKIEAAYFKTDGHSAAGGREFTARDTAAAPNVAIVSERVVRNAFRVARARRSAGACVWMIAASGARWWGWSR